MKWSVARLTKHTVNETANVFCQAAIPDWDARDFDVTAMLNATPRLDTWDLFLGICCLDDFKNLIVVE